MSSIKIYTRNALKSAHEFAANIDKLRTKFAGQTQEDIRAALLVHVADYYGCALNPKGTGLLKADAKRNATREALKRMVRAIVGTSQSARKVQPSIRAKASESNAAKELLEACGGNLNRARAILAKLAK